MYTSKKELNENHRNEKSIQTKIKPTKSIKQKLGEWKKMCQWDLYKWNFYESNVRK